MRRCAERSLYATCDAHQFAIVLQHNTVATAVLGVARPQHSARGNPVHNEVTCRARKGHGGSDDKCIAGQQKGVEAVWCMLAAL